MKNTKKLLFGLFLSPILLLAGVTLTSLIVPQLAFSKNKQNEISNNNHDFNYTGNISAFTSFDQKIYNETARTPQTQYYETELSQNSDFKYPGYDFNYEDRKNNITKEKYNKVYNERVQWNNKDWKYSDAKWIASQIYQTSNENITSNLLQTPILKIHPAQKNFYAQNVSDSTQSVTKKIRFSSNITGKVHLGLYAPAGEIIKIKLSDKTFAWTKKNKSNPFEIIINNSYWDNYAYGNSGQISNRYPFVRTTFNADAGFKPSEQQEYSFGSPFGGSISINLTRQLNEPSGSPILNNAMDIEFEVSGAVPELYYIHGVTTEEDWNQQIQDVKDNKITAPAFSVNSSFFSFSVPFTTTKTNINGKEEYIKSIGHTRLEDIFYPKAAFDKWQQFFFISYYYSSKDKHGARKIDMQYCDDVWGGAGAWGGGDALYAETSWSNIFYREPSRMTITNSWGVFHEINHNYQQDAAFFRKKGHPQTNQVSMVAYSIINDASRFRNEERPYGNEDGGGWGKLSNGYWNIKTIRNNGNSDEYSLYGALLYSFGPYLYMDYVRDDVVNHSNGSSSWTGVSEIIRLSHYFKLNLYPTFLEYGKYWSDWTQPTSSEQEELTKIANEYPTYHFNANMYAAGSYLYDYQTTQFIYTGDYAAPYEIPAGLPYTFDFEQFINSPSDNFEWSELVFNATSKNGAKLSLDPTNHKKLIYTPTNIKNFSEDEFDIAIIPKKNRAEVPMYKWKIKVKPNVYGVTAENVDLTKIDSNNEFNHLRTTKEVTKSRIVNTYNVAPAFYTEKKEGIRINSTFIPNKTGLYSFKGKWDDKVRIYVNDEEKFNSDTWVGNTTDMFSMQMEQNKRYEIEILVINTGGLGNFELSTNLDGTSYNILDNSISPHIIKNFVNKNPLDIINDPTTKYKDRSFDPYLLQGTLSKFLNQMPNIFLDVNEYDFESESVPNSLKYMKEIFTDSVWEVWSSNQIDLKIKYKSTTKVAGLVFGHRTNNWTNLKPKNIKIIGINNKSKQTYSLYVGEYGKQNNDKYDPFAIFKFDKIYDVNEINISFIGVSEGDHSGISLKFIQTLKENYYGMNSLVDEKEIQYDGKWKVYQNGQNNWFHSLVNNMSKYTTTNNSRFKFKVKANGFSIAGTTKDKLPQFDVYINGIKTNLFYPLEINRNNLSLFYYATNQIQEMEVEVFYRGGGELIIDYITTNGKMDYSIR